MTQFRRVTDLAEAARQGFRLVINNRPDGEEPGQLSSGEMAAAASAAGLDYAHVPVRGGPTQEQVETQARLIAQANGPTLAYCRSGTRSIVTWALGEALSGARGRDELVRLGRDAGYDLSGVLPG